MTDGPAAVETAYGRLGTLCSSWRDVQQTRLQLEQRGMTAAAEALAGVETSLGREVIRELRRQPVWPWLEQHPGVRGVHVARLVAIIGDPRRFPGQGCTEGHAFAPDYPLGGPCPARLGPDAVPCSGCVVARPGTGVRSLWRYLGLDVVDGHSPRKRKGQQAHWHMEGRAAVLQPGGIAEQIVRQGVEPWVGIYRATKARLTETRASLEGTDIARVGEIENPPGLRPFQIDAIARKVAAKAFLGDLLTEWKHRTVKACAIDDRAGPVPARSEAAA